MARGLSGQRKEWRIGEFAPNRKRVSEFVQDDLDQEQQKKVAAYWKKCREHAKGPSWNPYKFKKLKNSEDIWEMKPSA